MKINEKEYKLNITGYTLVIYKEKFKKDLFKSLNTFKEDIDMVSILEILWACIKSSYSDVPDFEEFASSIENVGMLLSKETFTELSECIKRSSKRTINPKM